MKGKSAMYLSSMELRARAEGKTEISRRMMAEGLPDALILRITELSAEELARLRH